MEDNSTKRTTKNSINASTTDLAEIAAQLKNSDTKLLAAVIMNEFSKLKKEFVYALSSKVDEIKNLKLQVNELSDKVAKLENVIDNENAYERRDCLVLSGDAVSDNTGGESAITTAKDVIKNKLKINLDMTRVSTAHRMGRKTPGQGPDKRPIILKFCQRDTKTDILVAARKARAPGFFVSESLSPNRRKVFYNLRKLRREFPTIIRGCTTFDGNIYAYTKPALNAPPDARNSRALLNTQESLDQFCRNFLKKPLDSFLAEWSA